MIWLAGGNGYIGTHLHRQFSARGVQTFSTGRTQCDLVVGSTFPKEVTDGGVEAVILLAGLVRSTREEEIITTNVTICTNLMRGLVNAGMRVPIFFLSSLHVYPLSDTMHKFSEHVRSPRSAYGCAKQACEHVLMYYAERYNLPLWIGRAGNVLATELPINVQSFLRDFLVSLKANRRIDANTRAVRDLVSVEDLATGMLLRLGDLSQNNRLVLENVCSGRPVHLVEIARCISSDARTQGLDIQVNEFEGEQPDVLIAEPPMDRIWGNGPDLHKVASFMIEQIR